MKMVAFDLASYKTGIAFCDLSHPLKIIKCEQKEFIKGTDQERATRTVMYCLKAIQAHDPSVVFIEDTRIPFGRAIGYQNYYTLGNIRLVAQYCDQKKIQVVFVPIQSWKGYLFKKGWNKRIIKTQRKIEAIRHVRSIYPHLDIRDNQDDSAEATALLHWAINNIKKWEK